jgi:hypothetical protein
MLKRLASFGLAAALCAGCPSGDDQPEQPDAAGFEPWTLEDPGPGGFNFETDIFDVAPGEEVQRCYFIEVPDIAAGGDIWFSRVKTAINPGSHHMNVFRVKTIVALDGAPGTMIENGECFKSVNWADWPLVANSQNSQINDPYTDWQLPANVAHKFTAHEKLMVQVHYVNAGTQETPFRAKAGINFYKSPDAAPMELGTLFATQQSIRICQSDPQPSYSGACSFGLTSSGVKIIAANGHFHSRGKQFSMFSWDGVSTSEPAVTDRFYQSAAWDEPEMATGMDIAAPAGGGVWWTCDYQWSAPAEPLTCADINAKDPEMANDCCYIFGGKVETSEHCNAFVYYYPKVDSSDVFCN